MSPQAISAPEPRCLSRRRLARRRSTAFTMVELISVIAVIVIVAGLVVFSPGLGRSSGLTTAGNQVMEDLAYARELAVSSNEPTEVWFLRPSGGAQLNATQIYTVDQNGTWSPSGGVHHLPASVGVDSGTSLSSLFTASTKKVWTSQAQAPISGYGTSYDAWAIRFMPDGTVGNATQNVYVTLHDVSKGDKLTALPANYALINIDYVTGAVSSYRP
jgi:uncharacterized protein (TIGR02596 family)